MHILPTDWNFNDYKSWSWVIVFLTLQLDPFENVDLEEGNENDWT